MITFCKLCGQRIYDGERNKIPVRFVVHISFHSLSTWFPRLPRKGKNSLKVAWVQNSLPSGKMRGVGVCTQATLKQHRPIAKFKVFTLLYYLKGLERWCLKAVATNSLEIPCGTMELAWDSVPVTHPKRS